ncbi:response regulator [Paenibacillus sp. MBLB4367]|uniref:response regulator n=1 Tax=Paenibacillus sp. MBLB4367 TaxID=3384767 RepID=UPI0039084482
MTQPYKVIVADDEKQVRERIVQSFPWERLGMEIAGTACDGREALQLVQSLAPHIVLTDIRMPGMDGLELAAALRERHPGVKVVVLSAYDDFKYAQDAIRAGVKGYLLKPLAQEEFAELFRRIGCELDQEHRSSSREDVRERFLIDLLKGAQAEPAGDRLKELGLQGLNDFSRVAICVFERRAGQEMRFSRLQRAFHMSDKYWSGHGIPTMVYGGSQVIFFHDRKPLSKGDVQRMIAGFAAKLESFDPELDLSSDMTIGVGNLYGEPGSIGRSYNEAIFASSCRYFQPAESVFYFQDIVRQEAPALNMNELIAETVQALFAKSDEGGRDPLEVFFKQAEACGKSDVRDLHSACIELLIAIKLKARDLGIAVALPERKEALERIQSFRSLHELKSWFLTAAGVRPAERALCPAEDAHDYISRAKAHVQRHLADKISLEEVAESLYINASYFSHTFKKQTGQNFVDYVNEARVRKAAELIRQTNYRIKEISLMVGYKNFSYFNKVFKSIVGVKPLLYRSGAFPAATGYEPNEANP